MLIVKHNNPKKVEALCVELSLRFKRQGYKAEILESLPESDYSNIEEQVDILKETVKNRDNTIIKMQEEAVSSSDKIKRLEDEIDKLKSKKPGRPKGGKPKVEDKSNKQKLENK